MENSIKQRFYLSRRSHRFALAAEGFMDRAFTGRICARVARGSWRTDKGVFWSWEGQTFSPHGYYTAAQGSGAMWAIERGGVMREGESRPTTAELRLTDMDRDGAEASIMYGPTDPMVFTDAELSQHCYEAYNDWLAEFCRGETGAVDRRAATFDGRSAGGAR